MMRHLTEEELQLTEKFCDPNLSDDEKEKIVSRLMEIDEEQTKDYPFAH